MPSPEMAKIDPHWGETADSLFQRSITTENRRLRERYVALALIASGVPVIKAAERIGRRRQTISTWIRHFNEAGPDGLLPNYRRSATTILSEADLLELRDALAQSPSDHGFEGTTWRSWQIAEFIAQTFGKRVHQETARRYKNRLVK